MEDYSKPTLIRRRFIPYEENDISNDEIIELCDDYLLTRWKPIKPRKDIGCGISCTYFTRNYKISAFYDTESKFKYWYCDIICTEIRDNTYIFTDLLADIKYTPGKEPEVLDIDELEDAKALGYITDDDVDLIYRTLDTLLAMIAAGTFPPNKDKFYL